MPLPLARRHKTVLILLLLYWPAIFIATHIPQLPGWVSKARMSDKTMHYLAYMALGFLWWHAISPYNKVNWKKPAIWWTLALMVWYGAMDEWLQHYVGRTPDLFDFLADFTGAITSLILLTIFSFWPASLIIAGIFIFVITNLSHTNMIGSVPVINAGFHFLAYAVLSLLWVQNMQRFLPLQRSKCKWFIEAIAVPTIFLMVVKLFSIFFGKQIWVVDIVTASTGILLTVIISYLIILCKNKFSRLQE